MSQQKLVLKQEDNDRMLNQITAKNSDIPLRGDNTYHMIPIDRKEQSRQGIEELSNRNNHDEQQLNIKNGNEEEKHLEHQEISLEVMVRNKSSEDKNINTIDDSTQNDE